MKRYEHVFSQNDIQELDEQLQMAQGIAENLCNEIYDYDIELSEQLDHLIEHLKYVRHELTH